MDETGRDEIQERLAGFLNGFLLLFSAWFLAANLWQVGNHGPATATPAAIARADGPLPPAARGSGSAPVPESPPVLASTATRPAPEPPESPRPLAPAPSPVPAATAPALEDARTLPRQPARLRAATVEGAEHGYSLRLEFDRPVLARTSYLDGSRLVEVTLFPVERKGMEQKIPPLAFLESVAEVGSGQRGVLRLQLEGGYAPRPPLPVGETTTVVLHLVSGGDAPGLPPGSVLNRLARKELRPGLVEERYRYKPGDKGGSDVYLLEVNPADPGLELGVVRGKGTILGKEGLSRMARRADALAGVNASFFSRNGDPLGLLAERGRVLSMPLRSRGVLGVFDGGRRSLVGNPGYSGRIDFAGGSLRLDGVNQVRKPSKSILYTPEWGETTGSPGGGFEMAVQGGRIVSVADGNLAIPRDGFVVAVQGGEGEAALTRLGLGEGVRLVSGLTPPWNRADFAIGGGPVLVKAARRKVAWREEAFSRSLVVQKAPRTAVGVRGDGHLVFAVVDGRRPGVNRGVDLYEMADIMIELGCREALNLDGGGSSTLVHSGRVQNRPSDGHERAISTGIVVLPRRSGEAPPVVARTPAPDAAPPVAERPPVVAVGPLVPQRAPAPASRGVGTYTRARPRARRGRGGDPLGGPISLDGGIPAFKL